MNRALTIPIITVKSNDKLADVNQVFEYSTEIKPSSSKARHC